MDAHRVAVLVKYRPDIGDHAGQFVLQLRVDDAVSFADLLELPGLGFVECAAGLKNAQLVTAAEQRMGLLIALEKHDQRRGIGRLVHQQVGIQRAAAKLLTRKIPISVLVKQGPGSDLHVREADPGRVQQRHIEYAQHRIHCRQIQQVFTQGLEPCQGRIGEQRLRWRPGDDQEVIGAIAGANLAVVMHGIVTLEDQRLGRGIELEVTELRSRCTQQYDDQPDRNPGALQRALVVESQQ